MSIDDKAIQSWIAESFHPGNYLFFDWLPENQGSCAISTIESSEDDRVNFIDGSSICNYDFMLQAIYQLSDGEDSINTSNMSVMRQWQDWIEEQEINKNYPEIGEGLKVLEIQNLSTTPSLANITNNLMAKYQFAARIIYFKERK